MSSAAAWVVLLWAAGLAMLALPFVPLWREWARPADSAPLAVSPESGSDAGYFARELRHEVARGAPGIEVVARALRDDAAVERDTPLYVEGDLIAGPRSRLRAVLATGNVRLGAKSEVWQWMHADGRIRLAAATVALRRVTAGRSIRLEAGCSFERLSAPVVIFGARSRARPATPRGSTPMGYGGIARAVRRTASLYRVAGACVLPAGAHFEGSLVVTGTLLIGADTTIRGDLKAREGLVVGERCAVLGAITCERSIEVGARAFVKGPVISETDVILGAGVVIGSVELPTTVTAEDIVVETGAVVHGAIWARKAGIVWDGA